MDWHEIWTQTSGQQGDFAGSATLPNNNPRGGRHRLEFCQIWILTVNLVGIRSNTGRLYRCLTDFKMRGPPSWIYFQCLFLSFGRFWVAAADDPVKFHKFTSIYRWFTKLCQKIQNGDSRHRGLLFGHALTLDHTPSILIDGKFVFKFHVNPLTAHRLWDTKTGKNLQN